MKAIHTKSMSFEEMKGSFPDIIYKYRKLNDHYHLSILKSKEIYFAPPSSFPDPLDCKAEVDYAGLDSREKYLWVKNIMWKKYPLETYPWIVLMSREKLKESHLHDSKWLRNEQAKWFDRFDAETGVFSATAEHLNEKMWKEYADNHSGFCVGFNSLDLFPKIGFGGPVQYCKKLPRVLPEPMHTLREQMCYQYLFKEEKWEFEKEYRLAMRFKASEAPNRRTLVVPAKAFNSIIFGKLVSEPKLQAIRGILHPDLANVPIYKVNDHMKLDEIK